MIAEIVEFLELILHNIASIAGIGLEFIGVFIVIWTGAKAFIMYLKKSDAAGLYLAKGMSTALTFKMGSEILRTVVIREKKELFFVAGIMLIRAAMSLLLHWEIKQEEKEHTEQESPEEETVEEF